MAKEVDVTVDGEGALIFLRVMEGMLDAGIAGDDAKIDRLKRFWDAYASSKIPELETKSVNEGTDLSFDNTAVNALVANRVTLTKALVKA